MALCRHQVRSLINAGEALMFPLSSDICDFLNAKANGVLNDFWECDYYSAIVAILKNKESSVVFTNNMTEDMYHNMYDYILQELEKINTELLIYKLDLITKN